MHKTLFVMHPVTQMNDADKATLKQQIAARLSALDEEDALGAEGQSTVTLDQQMVGRLSRMDALQSQAMARATQSRRDHERQRLHSALSRLDTEDYGYCEDCGEAIPFGRLKLDPSAARCIECLNG